LPDLRSRDAVDLQLPAVDLVPAIASGLDLVADGGAEERLATSVVSDSFRVRFRVGSLLGSKIGEILDLTSLNE